MVQLGELMMILELHRHGLSVTAIARRTGRDPKTVRKYIERGVEAPVYGPRSVGRPSKLAPFMGFLRERVVAFYVLHQDLQTLLRCHIQAFDAIVGVPIEILYDRMKTAVSGEDDQGHIAYNRSLLALARHYRFQPRACRPYRAKTKGKVERPFSYIRQDFFLGRSFRNLEDLNAQLIDWLDTVANVRVHGTTQRIVAEAFAAEQPELQRLPEHRFDAVLKLERRVSHDGFVAIGGNYYSVPDRTRRIVEVQQLPDLIRILDLGNIVAEHPVLEGRRQYRIDRSHRTGGSAKRKTDLAGGVTIGRVGDHVPLRPLAIYQAIGAQLASAGRP